MRREKVLASATTTSGEVVSGTRDAFLFGERRLPWEQVQSADWDADTFTLRVAEVGEWGRQRPVHTFVVDEPGRLLELVRERITASLILQRHVPVVGRRGLFVIGRRPPRGDAPITWVFDYQEGIDPEDPAVRLAAAEALRTARDDVGLD